MSVEVELQNGDAQVQCAKTSEQCERYEEMAGHMKMAAELRTKEREGDEVFTAEERNLFSVAYKNVVGGKRSAYRQCLAMQLKIKDNDSLEGKIVKREIELVVNELKGVCTEVLDIIDNYLLNPAKTAETKVFYCKMKGDYYRYLAEVESDDQECKDNAEKAYEKAQEAAQELASTHPIRLGLALNFSVFYYEIQKKNDKACELAKKAFDDAISELDTLKEESYKDSTLIMQLLRDNLTLWTSDTADQQEEEDDAQNE